MKKRFVVIAFIFLSSIFLNPVVASAYSVEVCSDVLELTLVNQQVGIANGKSIKIKEPFVGSFKKGETIRIAIEEPAYIRDTEYSVVSGDLKVIFNGIKENNKEIIEPKTKEVFKLTKYAEFIVEEESRLSPGVIELSEVIHYPSRYLMYGYYNVFVFGSAIDEILGKNDVFLTEPYIYVDYLGDYDPFYFDKTNIYVLFNNIMLSFDSKPFIENDRVLVPIRKISETFGACIEWDRENSTAKILLNDKEVVLTEGSNIAFINKQPQTIDISLKIVDERLFIPLRFISEIFEADVIWDEEYQTVKIYDC